MNAEIFPKEIAEKMELDALNAAIEKFGKPGDAIGVNGAFKGEQGDDFWDKYDPYAAAEEGK